MNYILYNLYKLFKWNHIVYFYGGEVSGFFFFCFFQNNYFEIHPYLWADQYIISLLMISIPFYGAMDCVLYNRTLKPNPQLDCIWR